MADSDKLDSDELGEVDDLDTAKQAETAEGADVVSHAAEGGTDAAEADLAEVDDASAKRTEEDVAAKGSGEDGEPEEAPAKGKRGKKRASKKDAAKGSSKKDGSSEEETTEKGSKARRKQKESSAESSKKGSGNPEKGTKRSTEKKAAEKKASSKERKPARVKGLQSPKWWAPLLVTLMIVGLVIVVTAYIFGGNFPIKGLGNGNLFIGFGFMLTGFLMTMGWK